MDLQALKEEFEHWSSNARTQQERDREGNALAQALEGITAIEQGKINPKDSCGIARDHLLWLREYAEPYRQRVEIPVYIRYIAELERGKEG